MAFDRPPAGADPNIGLIVARAATPQWAFERRSEGAESQRP